jgi:hypothetical protein
MHVHGDQLRQTPAENTYPGDSMPRHAEAIKRLIDTYRAKTILDYGAGKGLQYKQIRVKVDDGREFPSIPAYWGIDALTCYDPAYEPFIKLPQGTFDGVVCTDVLEHCPEDDLNWILDEMFSYARKFVYANVACYPALKRLPTGENAHCTIRPTPWWEALVRQVAAQCPGVRFQFSFDRFVTPAGGNPQMVSDIVNG